MQLYYKILVTYLVFVLLPGLKAYKYTLCTVPRYSPDCEQLNRTEDINCVIRKNNADCMLLLEKGNVTFAIASAEEAALASSLLNRISVLAEFRDTTTKSNIEYSTVVLMKKHLKSFSFKGAKFCHPGLDKNLISRAMLTEFEMKVLAENNIDVCSNTNNTLVENYISTLSNYFGPSCLPGSWVVANKILDGELKLKYPPLSELCNQPAYQENKNSPFLQSLDCALSGDGEIAITSLSDLKRDSGRYEKALQEFLILCKNGTAANITAECVWNRQPRSLVITNEAFTLELANDFRVWFSSLIFDNDIQLANAEVSAEGDVSRAIHEKLIGPLQKIVFPDKNFQIKIVNSSLKAYLKDFGRDIPSKESSQLCKKSIRFCISEAEREKCKWLQQAGLNYGMQPVIECAPLKDKTLCINEIQAERADLTITSDNMMYYATRKQNFSILAFGEQDLQDMQRTILIVNTTKIKSLQDLKGKRGCFSEYGDRAYFGFITATKGEIWQNSSPFYIENIGQFLNKSCMPGIEDLYSHEPYPSNLDTDKLCQLCTAVSDADTHSTCKPDANNDYFGDHGALKCLVHSGDFAVLTMIENITLGNDTAVMCKNGTLTTSFPIDDECVLSLTIDDILFARKNDSKTKDILLLIEEIDYRFAINSDTPFKVYDRFGTEKDLIFKDATKGVEIATTTTNRYMNTQKKMFESMPQLISVKNETFTDDNGSACQLATSITILPMAIFLILIQIDF
ncbi:hypothetical protein Trydic_g1487 [Trypoxylus dichotomus]